jgi:hypothetical protein
MTCYDKNGFATLDAYGQWTGDFRRFNLREGKELKRKIRAFLPLPVTNFQRYMLQLEDNTVVVMNEPNYQSAIHQFGREHQLPGQQHRMFVYDSTQILICYSKRESSNNYAVRALLMDHAGFVKRPDQIIMSGIWHIVAIYKLSSGDVLVIGSCPVPATFKYVLIRKAPGN